MVDVRWLGAAGLEFTHDGRTILIDPYYTRSGKREAFFGRPRPSVEKIDRHLAELPAKLSAVIVGHTHFDHALDIHEVSKRYDGPLIGSRSLETLMRLHGTPGRTRVCDGGERVELPGGDVVTMIRSQHGLVVFGRVPYPGEIDPRARLPMKASEYRHGTVFMPKLEMGGITFMQCGSANYLDANITGQTCDVLFMCVPGWKKIPGYTSHLVEVLAPKVIVPFHFDDLSAAMPPNRKAPKLPFQSMDAFRARVMQSAPQAEFRVPETFERLSF